MKRGYLSEFFTGVAIKTLSAVEAEPVSSNQHEFNGVKALRRLLGDQRQTFKATFIYLSDNDPDPLVDDGYLTWYDSRENIASRSAEYRLYFPQTTVSVCAAEGDLLVIARKPDGNLLAIIAQGGSTITSQILWLFGIEAPSLTGFSIREALETDQDRIHFASGLILEQLGIVPEVPDAPRSYLDTMLAKFGGVFPSTNIFSAYARSTLPEINPISSDPDTALMAWMEREEILFRTLEKHLLADRLQKGFVDDVDGFIAFSLKVQNRRKSRSGYALENHFEAIFKANVIRYERGAKTEDRSKPDFLFPGSSEYKDRGYDATLLTMLGAKTTCKDRWRQVLAEANRIEIKHLLTLEAAISRNQTKEMQDHRIQLVIPRSLHATYAVEQQQSLMDVQSFTTMVKEKEKRAGAS
ncbi:MAG TPA: type II restriction endonuclease [Acidisarcina sp.]